MSKPLNRLLLIEKERPGDLAVYRAGLVELAERRGLAVELAQDDAAALRVASRCDLLAVKAHDLTQEVVDAMPALRFVQGLTSGIDKFNQLRWPCDIPIASARGIHGPQMCELIFMFMLTLLRDFPALLDAQRQQDWLRGPQRLLEGRTLLCVGVGAIGEALAVRANAFGMRVTGASKGRASAPGFAHIFPYSQMEAALTEADFVVLLTPYDQDTHRLVDARFLSAMRRDAYLINVARGGVLDEGALINALQHNRIAGAGLDVFDTEPLPQGSPLWDAPNLLLTPHVGGISDRYARQILPILCANLEAVIAQDTDSLVNRIHLTAGG